MGKGEDQGPFRKGGTYRREDGGSKMRDEGQVRADMEEMRVHGEERRKVKAAGVGDREQTGEERRVGEGRAPHLLRPRAMKD